MSGGQLRDVGFSVAQDPLGPPGACGQGPVLGGKVPWQQVSRQPSRPATAARLGLWTSECYVSLEVDGNESARLETGRVALQLFTLSSRATIPSWEDSPPRPVPAGAALGNSRYELQERRPGGPARAVGWVEGRASPGLSTQPGPLRAEPPGSPAATVFGVGREGCPHPWTHHGGLCSTCGGRGAGWGNQCWDPQDSAPTMAGLATATWAGGGGLLNAEEAGSRGEVKATTSHFCSGLNRPFSSCFLK